MASFKFGFNLSTDDVVEDDKSDRGITNHDGNKQTQSSYTNKNNERVPVSKIEIDDLLKNNNIKKPIDKWSSTEIKLSEHNQQYYSSLQRIANDEKPFFDSINEKDTNNDNDDALILSTVQGNETDIIPGKYEGGLKVWECSIDLCNYLAEQISSFYVHQAKDRQHASDNMMDLEYENDVHFLCSGRGGNVIELGCGHGLPGCLILKEMMKVHQHKITERLSVSSNVIFTDYNAFVLRDVTLPNILLNCVYSKNEEEINLMKRMIGLYAGDWMDLSDKLKNGLISNNDSIESDISRQTVEMDESRFNLILASETTYTNTASTETACWLMKHLKPCTGVGLVSMKRYYFGVGGGSDSFCTACKSFGLTVELVKEFNDGASNIRDLWRVKLPCKS